MTAYQCVTASSILIQSGGFFKAEEELFLGGASVGYKEGDETMSLCGASDVACASKILFYAGKRIDRPRLAASLRPGQFNSTILVV